MAGIGIWPLSELPGMALIKQNLGLDAGARYITPVMCARQNRTSAVSAICLTKDLRFGRSGGGLGACEMFHLHGGGGLEAGSIGP